jgi:putative phosphoesterase
LTKDQEYITSIDMQATAYTQKEIIMKILVLSDSHSTLSFMRRCIEAVKPDAVIHLGDHFDDGEAMHEEYPTIPLYQVPGNCDRYRCHPDQAEILIGRICGVNLYMTHGHKHSVKSYLGALLRDARAAKVDAVLYGHTHIADCHREDDGLWVLNPGSCGYFGGSAGLILADNGKIWRCLILKEEDLLRSW